jgi:hypothetical protein
MKLNIAVILASLGVLSSQSYASPELSDAVREGRIADARTYLQRGDSPNYITTFGGRIPGTVNRLSLLKAAIAANNLPMVELLTEFRANVNAEDLSGGTPIHYAADLSTSNGIDFFRAAPSAEQLDTRLKIIQHLIKKRAKVNHKSWGGNTALHSASNPQIIARLLAAGANPNIKNMEGNTPLAQAVESKYPQDIEKIHTLIPYTSDLGGALLKAEKQVAEYNQQVEEAEELMPDELKPIFESQIRTNPSGMVSFLRVYNSQDAAGAMIRQSIKANPQFFQLPMVTLNAPAFPSKEIALSLKAAQDSRSFGDEIRGQLNTHLPQTECQYLVTNYLSGSDDALLGYYSIPSDVLQAIQEFTPHVTPRIHPKATGTKKCLMGEAVSIQVTPKPHSSVSGSPAPAPAHAVHQSGSAK